MTSDQIDQLGQSVSSELPTLIGDLSPRIREAAAAVLEETQEKENAKPTLNITIGVSVNLATNPPAYIIKAGVSVKHTVSTELVLDDPNQPELPEMEKSVVSKRGKKASHELQQMVKAGKLKITTK